jgi:hypothetical protein
MENGDLVYVILFVGILMENARMAFFLQIVAKTLPECLSTDVYMLAERT